MIANARRCSWPFACVAAMVLGMVSSAAWAGPPFLTDDPAPLDYQHSEFYVFSTMDKTRDGNSVQAPAIEFNYGALPDVHLHVMVPFANALSGVGPTERGLGDIELGVKYRFVHETDSTPQIGVFPMAEVPMGNADKGLGNGRTWYRLPIWLQKSWGHWTSYGGGGYAINHAPGQSNYWFGGWLLQRDLSEKLTLGGELYTQGPAVVGGNSTTIANFGGYWNFNPNFSLLFSEGHSVAGESHSVAYVALYWTWGPGGERH